LPAGTQRIKPGGRRREKRREHGALRDEEKKRKHAKHKETVDLLLLRSTKSRTMNRAFGGKRGRGARRKECSDPKRSADGRAMPI